MSRFYVAVLFWVSVQVGVSSTRVKRIRGTENYRGPWPWYLTKVELAADVLYKAELAGNEDGIFELDLVSGFLCALKPFDREEKANYTVTVIWSHCQITRSSPVFGTQVIGGDETVTVIIEVTDENDNSPVLHQSSLRGVVSRGTRAGVSFMHVGATDGDDPATEKADLRYTIIQPDESVFQIEPRTGAVSLTEQGVTVISRGDVGHFRLLVQVKDLAGSPLGLASSGNLEIAVAENTWSAPDPVSIPENRKGDYPDLISEVRWNSTEIRYDVSGNFLRGLFTADQSGNIYVAQELDRESQSEYEVEVSALNTEGVPYAAPLRLTVTVTDENDNAPLFTQHAYNVEITEAAEKALRSWAQICMGLVCSSCVSCSAEVLGSDLHGACRLLLELKAEDGDDPSTRNAEIVYNIESQEPGIPGGGLFRIGGRSGRLTLQEDGLEPATYTLIVSATDRAGEPGGLRGSCTVMIEVKDVNDSPPVFTRNQFPPFMISEDAAPGTSVVTLTVTDGDVETENKAMEFSVQSGNEDGTFSIKPDEDQNTVTVFLDKVLDFERVQEYRLAVAVKNAADLVGAEYGSSSTASIVIAVGNVNEPPIFAVEKYEARVPENTPPGVLILTVSASDPDIRHQTRLRFSIGGDDRNWLSIDEDSGEIRLRHSVDSEQYGDTYNVSVLAREAGDGGLSASAVVVIRILDVNDNIPILTGDYSSEYFCTPRREEQRTIIRAFDGDSPENDAPIAFSLPNDAALRSQWMLTAINGTHAYLSMRSRQLEPKVHRVPIVITDSGAPPQSKHVPITVCHCNSRARCKVDVGRMEGMPTLSSALGITLGTLGAIGIFLIIIFSYLALSTPRRRTETTDGIPLKSAI
ncbi:PREDICTED: cadherin-16 [Nanorana parkeri]|uniref:cadherin-16 n=1 Tax=Nanorana parkeri TaxID=125878 RepID=UPI000854279B|nr:PREDICTED: cadherin-16 [Nanorana parkeri]